MKRTMDHTDRHESNPKKLKHKNDNTKSYPYVLTIIDMQPAFSASNKRRVLNVIRKLLNQAVKDGAYIMFAEYKDYGETHESLVNLTENYNHRSFPTADRNDKSIAILSEIIKKQIDSNRMKVCGVNTDACVQSTVNGLSEKLPAWSIHVIKNGCYTSSRMYPSNKYCDKNIEKMVLGAMARQPNVIIE